MQGCELCSTPKAHVVWSDENWLITAPKDPEFPAYYRLIVRRHVREFSELSADERDECARLLVAVEGSLIAATRPTKMNLATLGNVVPHLHWHVVARYTWDSRFPDAIWAPPRRQVHPSPEEQIGITTEALDSLVAEAVRMSQEHR